MKGTRVLIDGEQAGVLFGQFRETAAYRSWALLAVAVMANHIHIVVTVTGDPNPSDVLGDFKGYGSRALNRKWGRRPNGTWWTEGGSKRKLPDEAAVLAAVAYVRRQHNPLVVWVGPTTPATASGGRQPPE
jgi:REP element-mobilizing transposase RayT